MAYNYSPPPSGYPSYENKPVRNDYSTHIPGYTYYDYKRNDATSPSGKYTHPYTTSYKTEAQYAKGPSRRGHTRQVSHSSAAYSNPDSTRPTYQGSDLSLEAAPEESHEKISEVVNDPFAFPPGQLNKILNPKSMASNKDSSPAAYSFSKPSPTISGSEHAPSYHFSPLPRSSKPDLDRTMSDVYQDELYNPSMQDVPKTISPKDALLEDFDDVEEDAKTSPFTESETLGLKWGKRLEITVWSDAERWKKLAEKSMTLGVEQRHLRKDSLGLPRSSTFKRQEGEQRRQLTPVEPTTQGRSLLKTKQGLIGFANGTIITAMADTGSRKNVMSATYAKKLDLRIERLPSTFEIGNSRKIQSIGMYIYIYTCLSFIKLFD